jgi:hypothetical protein
MPSRASAGHFEGADRHRSRFARDLAGMSFLERLKPGVALLL